jgi:hypothetical protein
MPTTCQDFSLNTSEDAKTARRPRKEPRGGIGDSSLLGVSLSPRNNVYLGRAVRITGKAHLIAAELGKVAQPVDTDFGYEILRRHCCEADVPNACGSIR